MKKTFIFLTILPIIFLANSCAALSPKQTGWISSSPPGATIYLEQPDLKLKKEVGKTPSGVWVKQGLFDAWIVAELPGYEIGKWLIPKKGELNHHFVLHKHARIVRKVDRFSGEISITTKPEAAHRGKIEVCLIGVIKNKKVALALLQLVTLNTSWKYLRCHPLYLLVDGKPFREISTSHDGSVGRSYVLEFIRTDLNFEEIKKLSKAKRIEFKLCNTEREFSISDLEDLKSFVRMMEEEIEKP